MTQPPGSASAAARQPAYRPAAGPIRRAAIGERTTTWLARIAVMVIPIAFLWPLCFHEFTSWDDYSTVQNNPTLNPVTWHSLIIWWTTAKMDLYVPVTYTAWGIIACFARVAATATHPGYLDPVAFHTANLVLHALCCLVVFELLQLLARHFAPSRADVPRGRRRATGITWPAAIGALLFGMHPVQVETVGWVSGLKDVLMGLLALLAIWQYLLGAMHAQNGRRWRWNYALASMCFCLAMLAKPNALMAPVLAGVLDVLLIGRSWRRSAAWLWPWLVLAAGWIIVAKFVQPAPARPLNVAVPLRPLVAIASIGFYVRALVYPMGLAIDYGLSPAVAVVSPWLVVDTAFIVVASGLLWMTRRSARPLLAGAMFFVAALLPVLGFVTYDFQDYSNVADHYLYLPMFGVALMAAWTAWRWWGPVLAGVAPVLLATLGTVSYVQTEVWASTETLFVHVMDVNPDSAAAYHSLALVELNQARQAAPPQRRRLVENARQLAQKSIALRPNRDMGYIAYGMALNELGDLEGASRQYAKALSLNPNSEPALEDLAGVLERTGQLAKAEAVQAEVVRRNPAMAEAHFDLGLILEDEGKYAAAIHELQTSIALDPYVAKVHSALAYGYAKSGNVSAALSEYHTALQLDPRDQAAQNGLIYWSRAGHR